MKIVKEHAVITIDGKEYRVKRDLVIDSLNELVMGTDNPLNETSELISAREYGDTDDEFEDWYSTNLKELVDLAETTKIVIDL